MTDFPLRKGPSGVPTTGGEGGGTFAQVLRAGNTTGDAEGNSDILMSDGDKIEDEEPGHGLLMSTKDGVIGQGPAGINVVKGSGTVPGQSGAYWNCSGGTSGDGCSGTSWGDTQATSDTGGGWVCDLGGPGEGANKSSGYFTIITKANSGSGDQGHFYLSGPGSFLGLQNLEEPDASIEAPGYWSKSDSEAPSVPMYRDNVGIDHQLAYTDGADISGTFTAGIGATVPLGTAINLPDNSNTRIIVYVQCRDSGNNFYAQYSQLNFTRAAAGAVTQLQPTDLGPVKGGNIGGAYPGDVTGIQYVPGASSLQINFVGSASIIVAGTYQVIIATDLQAAA